MLRKIIFAIIILFPFFQLKAQTEKNTCAEDYSLYREFLKIDLYDFAIPHWKKSFTDCPSYNKNIYNDGVKIYKNYLENSTDEITKKAYLDTIILIYNQRIEYFGEEGFVFGKIGTDISKHTTDSSKIITAQNYLKKSIELKKDSVDAFVVYYFFKNALSQLNSNHISENEFIENYFTLFSIFDFVNYTETDKYYGVKDYIEKNVISVDLECNNLSNSLTEIYLKDSANIQILEKIIYLLEIYNCSETELYTTITLKLKSSIFAENTYEEIAKMFSRNKLYDKALNFYTEALSLNTNDSISANLYYEIASIKKEKNQFTEARKYAILALEKNKNLGKAYYLIGILYAQSIEHYDYNEFEKSAVYWFAVDKLEKAKTVDPSLIEIADKQITYYSFFFPSKELCFWYSIYEGSKYTINSWFSETTTARYNN